jgi:hypothetical protein
MNRWSRSFAGAVLLALVAALASACGEKPVSAVQVLAAAPDKTVAESTARISGEMTMTVGGKDTHATYDGAIELDGTGAEMTMDASSFGLPGAKIEMRIVDGAIFVGLDAIAAATGEQLPPSLAGKHWMSLDLSKMLEGAQAMQSDPSAASTSSLEYLRGVSADGVEEVGKEDVRGEPTTHYRADVDTGTLAKKLRDAKMSSGAREMLQKGLDALDGKTFTIDTWIDHDGRVRRQQFDQSMRITGQSVHTSMRMDFYDFGVKVDAEKPPADEVISLGDLASLGS